MSSSASPRRWLLVPLLLAGIHAACSGSSCAQSARVSQVSKKPAPTPGPTPDRRGDPTTAPPVLDASLEQPSVGASRLTVLTPRILELELVTTMGRGRSPERWDFVHGTKAELPGPERFAVTAAGQSVQVSRVGFRRRATYAPLHHRDLRISNRLYLEIARPLPDGVHVEVKNPDGAVFGEATRFETDLAPMRQSPAVHASQVGYAPDWVKKAFVGYYLGTLGELEIKESSFWLVDATSGERVFHGRLTPRREGGQPYATPPYQKVLEADFSAFHRPGQYVLVVPGVGASYRFRIDEGISAVVARTYALGLYHQRCGADIGLPFTRFAHARCHTDSVEIPSSGNAKVRERLLGFTQGAEKNPRHTAPIVKELDADLYRFARTGKVDVSGGHHDAGDYGKYTFNSAQLVHELVFAADAFPGAATLDNLGLPESGDGLSDLLQIARYEAEMLAKLQDSDGGFYYLVHPKDRPYEDDVLPERGDRQVVFPKNTIATAAATAALAQTGSSPGFKRAFPADAARYLAAARRGWDFLRVARSRFGGDGSYQRIGHYGDEFIHDDELAWAATELFLATGDKSIHEWLLQAFHPDDPGTVRWTWQRMFESYGAAIRSYAFAARTGRVAERDLDAGHLERCRAQAVLRGRDLVRWAEENAYGTSFPEPTKRFRTAGWYFSAANAFDLAVAYEIDPKPDVLAAIATNVSHELGANPLDLVFLTGLGWHRQREIVHQFAHNDRRVLPPSGIPLGSVQAGPPWLGPYGGELRELSFPRDDDEQLPYPIYDRWTDAHNVTTEFTVDTLGRGLGAGAFLMARGAMKSQPWRSATANIVVQTSGADATALSARLDVEGMAVEQAQVVWEAAGLEPRFGAPSVEFPDGKGATWLEAEAVWPDGRRVAAVLDLPSGRR